jgi:hypothetical protein
MATANFSELYASDAQVTSAEAYAKKYPTMIKGWRNFLAQCPRYVRPFTPDVFYTYGQFLVELGYSSASSYMMRAWYYESCLHKPGEKHLVNEPAGWKVKMNMLYTNIENLITKDIQQAKPFRLVDIAVKAPNLVQPILWALSCGCRPNALENAGSKFIKVRNNGAQNKLREVHLKIPRDKFCDDRTVRVFCCCDLPGRAQRVHPMCPLHPQSREWPPGPPLPITKASLSKALKHTRLDTVGYTSYSTRRAAAGAIKTMLEAKGKNLNNAMQQTLFASRVNACFGWKADSAMVHHYARDAVQLTSDEVEFFTPLFNYVYTGELRGERACDLKAPAAVENEDGTRRPHEKKKNMKNAPMKKGRAYVTKK